LPIHSRIRACLTGRVLLFAAEDALHVVRQRLAGIAVAAGVALADADIQVITVPSVRLDVERDRDALTATVAKLRPRLLVLDPFVRLHRIDENISGEVAPLLAYLRAPTPLSRRGRARASRAQGRREDARRPGAARLE
jgi:AAA domain